MPEIETKTIADFVAMDTQPESVVYKTVDDVELSLLVMQPAHRPPGQQRAAMVWIHGGGWTGGHPAMFVPHMRFAASRGAVAVSVQYRLVKLKHNLWQAGVSLEDAVADCTDAIRYIRNHAGELGIDPQKIIALGDSAGGHLALCLGVLPLGHDARVNAVIAFNPIVQLRGSNWAKVIRPGFDHDARSAQLSPLFHVATEAKTGMPPIQIQHGEADCVVPVREARDFYRVCQAHGVDSELVIWPGAGHAFVVAGYTATDAQITQALRSADAFLVRRGLLAAATVVDGGVNLSTRHEY